MSIFLGKPNEKICNEIVRRYSSVSPFSVNGTDYNTFKEALDVVNSSVLTTNEIKLNKNVNLDLTDCIAGIYNILPSVRKSVIIDLNGKTLSTTKVFGNKNDDWKNVLFKIEDSSELTNITIKNGNIQCVVPVDGQRTSILINASDLGQMHLEDLNVTLDVSNLSNGTIGSAIEVYQYGSTDISIDNVNCEVIGTNNNSCALAIQDCIEGIVTITNSTFKSTNTTPSAKYAERGGRAATVAVGDKTTVNMTNCTILGKNTRASVNVWNSGAILNITNSNVIAEADVNVVPGPCIYTEYSFDKTKPYDSIFPIVTMNNVNCTFPESTDSEMFAYQPNGVTSGGMSKFLLNGGTYEKFIFTETTPTLLTTVSAGTFDRNIALNPAVTLAEGKSCIQDPDTGKWNVM